MKWVQHGIFKLHINYTSKRNLFPYFPDIYACVFHNLVEYISKCLRKLIYNRHIFKAVDQQQILTFYL